MPVEDLSRGRLRSIWTHNVDATRLQPSHADTADPASGVSGSPSKKVNQQLVLLQRSSQQGFAVGKIDREVLCNALACAGASMADPLMSMVDTYYSGKLGTIALAALGSNGALFNVMYFLFFTALAVLCTQAMASANSKGDAAGVGRGFIQAMAATLVVSLTLVTLLLAVPEHVLRLFHTNAEVMPFARTYCVIRALSLPAALSMNICQAAFRSLLDLTTPFCVVMVANAANYLLDQLLMFKLGWGMAGCGWASVISQYIGAALFASIIYQRRHKFGLPEALSAAAADQADQQAAAGLDHTSSNSGNGWEHGPHASKGSTQHSTGCNKTKHQQQQQGPWAWWQQLQQHLHWWQSQQQQQQGQTASSSDQQQAGSISRQTGEHLGSEGVQGPIVYQRKHSGSLKINIPAMQQQAASALGGCRVQLHDLSPHVKTATLHRSIQADRTTYTALAPQQQQDRQTVSSSVGEQLPGGNSLSGYIVSPCATAAALQGPVETPAAAHAAAAVGTDTMKPDAAILLEHAPVLEGFKGLERNGADALSAAPADRQSSNHTTLKGSGSSSSHLWRLDSVGSESKLPRHSRQSTLQRLLVLLPQLPWWAFVRKLLGMTARGLLILSTYTSASVVAAKSGTAMMAAHQVVQQQQQLQMSIAWSFLHVGQSMTANVFHAAAPAGGPKAARTLANRIIAWAVACCLLLATATGYARHVLPGIFTDDVAVRQLVVKASLPATLMLAMAWNNALEGCLLGADDQPYVVKVYPWAVAAALAQLGRCQLYGCGLPGVWWGLMTYYLMLLVGFASRFFVQRSKI